MEERCMRLLLICKLQLKMQTKYYYVRSLVESFTIVYVFIYKQQRNKGKLMIIPQLVRFISQLEIFTRKINDPTAAAGG